jgi:hypothetical protein
MQRERERERGREREDTLALQSCMENELLGRGTAIRLQAPQTLIAGGTLSGFEGPSQHEHQAASKAMHIINQAQFKVGEGLGVR